MIAYIKDRKTFQTLDLMLELSQYNLILGAVIIVIYLLAMVMMWLEKKLQSKNLTEQLIKFQQKYSEEQ